MEPYRRLLTLGFLTMSVVAGCSGCGSSDPAALPAGWNILSSKDGDGRPASRRVLLIADSQLHHLYGDPIIEGTPLIDRKVSSTAIRPPQLDLFGQELLRWAVDRARGRTPILHLGDALDLACVAEFEQFAAIMSGPGNPSWVMTPGNHDAYFFGNFDDLQGHWDRACRRGGGPLTKDALVARYLQELARTRPTLARAIEAHPSAGTWTCAAPESDCFLQKAQWRIDTGSRWRSYIVQKVDLGRKGPGVDDRVSAILADSTQYPENPAPLLLHAGQVGSLLADQAGIIRAWVRGAEQRGEKLVLATHHPYRELSPPSRAHFDAFMRSPATLLMVSAHSHAGRYIAHGEGDRAWLELNVGSILDWPMEYRTLAFQQPAARHAGDKSGIMLVSDLIRIPRQWDRFIGSQFPTCDPRWEARPRDDDYYLDYRSSPALHPTVIQGTVYDNLLAAYRRMFRLLPVQSPARADAEASASPAPDVLATPASSPAMTRSSPRDDLCPGTPDPLSDDAGIAACIDRVRQSSSLDDKRTLLLWLRDHDRERRYVSRDARDAYGLCQAFWASSYEDRRARIPHESDKYIFLPFAPEE